MLIFTPNWRTRFIYFFFYMSPPPKTSKQSARRAGGTVTHHHELASTTSSWELQARKAAASSRCRTAPVRFLRTGLLSMVRRVTASQPVLGKVLCC